MVCVLQEVESLLEQYQHRITGENGKHLWWGAQRSVCHHVLGTFQWFIGLWPQWQQHPFLVKELK